MDNKKGFVDIFKIIIFFFMLLFCLFFAWIIALILPGLLPNQVSSTTYFFYTLFPLGILLGGVIIWQYLPQRII